VLRVSFLAQAELEPGERGRLASLTEELRLEPTYETERHVILAGLRPGLGRIALLWERHTELMALTLVLNELEIEFAPLGFDLRTLLPRGWLDAVGTPLVALQLAVGTALQLPGTPEQISERLFEGHTVHASLVMGGRAGAWTCYRTHGDGLGRMALVADGLSSQEIGRTVERLLAIEDLYHLVLLAQDRAVEAKPLLKLGEERLREQTIELERASTVPERRAVLEALLDLATDVEEARSRWSYRFAASSAYFTLLENRFAELREVKREGVLSLSRFVMRRLRPAANGYRDIASRLSDLSARIDRVADLLRTAIELNVEEQSLELLERVDRSVRTQQRFQEEIEILSTVVIAYYVLGVLGHALRGLDRFGIHCDEELVLAVSTPLLLVAIFFLLRAVQRRSRRHGDAPGRSQGKNGRASGAGTFSLPPTVDAGDDRRN
jgi:uncharacterized membrane-anchored protein